MWMGAFCHLWFRGKPPDPSLSAEPNTWHVLNLLSRRVTRHVVQHCVVLLCPPQPPNRIPAYRKLIGGCSGYPAVTLISAWPLVFGGGPDTLCCSAQSLAMRRLLYLSEHLRLFCSKMGSGRAADLREVTDTPQCLLLPSSMILLWNAAWARQGYLLIFLMNFQVIL